MNAINTLIKNTGFTRRMICMDTTSWRKKIATTFAYNGDMHEEAYASGGAGPCYEVQLERTPKGAFLYETDGYGRRWPVACTWASVDALAMHERKEDDRRWWRGEIEKRIPY